MIVNNYVCDFLISMNILVIYQIGRIIYDNYICEYFSMKKIFYKIERREYNKYLKI